MRILLVTSSLKPLTGWGTYSLNTLRGLRARGHDVFVLAEEASGEVPDEMVWLPNRLSMMTSPLAWVHSALAVRRAVRRCRPDVIHVLVETYAAGMPLAAMITPLPPWVMTFLATYAVIPFRRRIIRPLFTRAFEQAAGFVSCSRYTLDRVQEAVARFSSAAALRNVTGSTHMMRLGTLPLMSPVVRTPSGVEKRVLFVGEIKERKGVKEMLEGCGVFTARSGVPLHITLVGAFSPSHPYIPQLHETIDRHGLTGRVTFAGRVPADELEQLYASADVFMMLSKSTPDFFEGYGLVFLEANQRGIPVIGSRDSGCREAIDEGVSGYAVDADDPAEIADGLEKILVEGRIKPEGCIAWAAAHSIDGQAQAMEELYIRALTARPSA